MNTINLTKQLLCIPSFVDGVTNETKLGEFIYKNLSQFSTLSVEKQVFGENGRYNIIARGKKAPKIILIGHMDTVLPKAETIEPLKPRIKGNKLYGLGSTDMKAGLAIMLSLARKIQKDDIAFIFTCDEEYKFQGTKELVKIYSFPNATVINLEPTNNEILLGCRGITEFTFQVKGKSAHASRKGLGINAIEKTVDLCKILENEIKRFDTNQKSSLNLAYLNGGVLQEKIKDTFVISGKGLVVPDFADVVVEIRVGSSKVTTGYIKMVIMKIAKQLGITIENLFFKFYLEGMQIDKDRIKPFEKAIAKNNMPIAYHNVNQAGFFEVQFLQKAWGSDCIIFGPSPSEMAHCANEYVDIKSIEKTENVLEDFLVKNL